MTNGSETDELPEHFRAAQEQRAALPLIAEFQGMETSENGVVARVTLELTEESAYRLLRERQDLLMAYGVSAKGTGHEIQVLDEVLAGIQRTKIEKGQPIATPDAATVRSEFWQSWADRLDSAYATLRDAIKDQRTGSTLSHGIETGPDAP